jgi:hypothetical protein
VTLTLPGLEPPIAVPPWTEIDRAITLTQPWAGLVATGIKTIENRPWKLPQSMLGKRFAIHASREIDLAVIDKLLAMGHKEQPIWRITGAIIGVGRVIGCVSSEIELVIEIGKGTASPEQMQFWMGPHAFLLADQRAIGRPVECKGALGFWGLSESLRDQIVPQLREAA